MATKKKIGIFLAARSGSKRLPNKHFLKINNKLKMIDICILRLKKTKLVKKIFLCTTKKKNDDKFIAVCKKHKIEIFRGSENDVRKRYIDCAIKNSINHIVRITADCPIIDPKLIDKCIKLYFKMRSDYTSNTLKFYFPKGLDIEVINLNTLLISQKLSKNRNNKEHITPFIRNSKLFKKHMITNSTNYANRRWTLDYLEDYFFLKRVINFFYPNIYFSWKKLINAEKKNNFLINIKKRV